MGRERERQPLRCVCRALWLVAVVTAMSVSMAALPPDPRDVAMGYAPAGERAHFDIRDEPTRRGAGATCVYDENGTLTAASIRAPRVRSHPPLPLDPETGVRFIEQWVGWRPLLQLRFDDVKQAMSGDRDLAKVGRRFDSYSPGRRPMAAPRPGIYRALVRMLWFDPREAFKNVVRHRVTTRIRNHYDPAAGAVKRACTGPVSVVWSRLTRDEPAPRRMLPVRVTSDNAPVPGDFDGDGHGDVILYDANGRDEMWGGDGRYLELRKSRADLEREALPLPGDFDGDGRLDLFWYAGGADAEDEIWWGAGRGEFEVADESVRGSYRPAAGDFNGDGTTDVLWYGPGDGDGVRESVWWGTKGERAFHSSGALDDQVSGSYRPLAGNYNGDCCSDVLWLGAGGGEDSPTDTVWLGSSDGTFTAASSWGATPQIEPGYTAVPANLDGDCCVDVLLVPQGGGRYVYWWGSRDRGFVRAAAAAGRHPRALRHATPVSGNFYRGPDRDEILWVRPPG